jgi:hypothetical protein
MDSFTLGVPRWSILRAFSFNPLVRISDRVESIVTLLAVTVTLLGIAVVGAAATAVHDSHSTHTGAHTLEAARSSPDQTDHARTVQAPGPVTYGDSVDIPVNGNPGEVERPAATTAANFDAVLGGLALWLSVAVAAAAAVVTTRVILNRVRGTAWQHDIDNLVGDGEGHNSSQC